MRFKNSILPLLLCAAMVLFLWYVPQKVSDLYDNMGIGKPTVSEVDEDYRILSIPESVKLIGEYGTDQNIICVEDENFSGNIVLQRNTDGHMKRPKEALLSRIHEELSTLRQLTLIPEVSLDDLTVSEFWSERYLDIYDDNRYVSATQVLFRDDRMIVRVCYDIRNEKILTYDFQVWDDIPLVSQDENTLMQRWGEYLGIGREEAEKYYRCYWGVREMDVNGGAAIRSHDDQS